VQRLLNFTVFVPQIPPQLALPMPRHPTLCQLAFVCLVGLTWPTFGGDRALPNEAAEMRFFETEVRPILAKRCYGCHGEKKQKGSLRLDALETILGGGESGPALVPGKPDESLLIEAIRYQSLEMPPKEQLPGEEIATLTRWVRMGAPWPGFNNKAVRHGAKFSDADRNFWSLQPIRDVRPPTVNDNGWCQNEIDQFIIARQQVVGLTPAAPARRLALARRLYFGLAGLPPTPEQAAAFVADKSPTAYEDLVDRLLKSPRYGERFARQWLDLVRYAESDGYKADGFRPRAWTYRDYVIRAFNDDKPYNRFVMEQLAGDEIAPGNVDALAGTAFLRHWIYEYNQRDVRTQWSIILNDITDVTGEVFLGLSYGCARCHDHKFDPILRKDYYRLQAFFTPLMPRDDIPLATADESARYQQQLAEWEQDTAAVRSQLAAIAAPFRKRAADGAINKFPPDIRPLLRKEAAERTPLEHQFADLVRRQVEGEYDKLNVESKLKGDDKKRWQALQTELKSFDAKKPATLPLAFTVKDVGVVAPPTWIPGKTNDDIAPGYLTILDPADAAILPAPATSQSTGRRTQLARWITDPNNPLTARVIVNRVWQFHFGRGLVGTASDFGDLGDRPTHPELLDWLARKFVADGWSLKRLHRLIVTSATYQQSALVSTSELARLKDADNRLLWKMPIRRLESEQIRDAMLSVSGELDLTTGSASVGADKPRRAIYVKVLRNLRDPLMAAFDASDGFRSAPQRLVTTTPTQALLTINGSWTLQRAKALARRLRKLDPDTDDQLVSQAFRFAFGREPTADQSRQAVQFLQQQADAAQDEEQIIAGDSLSSFPGTNSTALNVAENPQSEPPRMANHRSLSQGDFTVEATIVLRSLYPDASVRTIVSQWNSNSKHPGWAFGVTSTKSGHAPRNLILQLVGDPAKGGAGYEVIASNLRPELNTPYHLSVAVKIGETGQTGVRFTLQELKPGAPLLTSHAVHKVTAKYRSAVPLLIGGRATSKNHRWDGLIDDVRISNVALPLDQLLLRNATMADTTVAFWRFDDQPGHHRDSSANGNHLQQAGTAVSADDVALIDFCHVLLNSNEFLYVD
jgi:mono/diheme cytochrome c family protein